MILIKSQNKKSVVNLVRIDTLSCSDGGEIQAFNGDTGTIIGRYKNLERAKEVLGSVYNALTSPPRKNYFDMPEE